MADFQKALLIALEHEGGYVDDLTDGGGETYAGISRKNNPRWTGWAIVDAHKPLKRYAIIKDPQLDIALAAIYRQNYWNKIWGENIKNQDVANFLFDWFVNSGYHAVTAIQKIVDARPDGVMSTTTVRLINNYALGDLLPRLIKARIDFVKGIVKNRPQQEKFLQGWLNRINSFA